MFEIVEFVVFYHRITYYIKAVYLGNVWACKVKAHGQVKQKKINLQMIYRLFYPYLYSRQCTFFYWHGLT